MSYDLCGMSGRTRTRIGASNPETAATRLAAIDRPGRERRMTGVSARRPPAREDRHARRGAGRHGPGGGGAGGEKPDVGIRVIDNYYTVITIESVRRRSLRSVAEDEIHQLKKIIEQSQVKTISFN